MKKLLVLTFLLVACGPASLPRADSGLALDPSIEDAGTADAGELDAGVVTAVLFPRVGSSEDNVLTPAGPGLVLAGGGADVDAQFSWMRQQLSASQGRLGDLVILRATGGDGYTQYAYDVAAFASVQTVLLPSPSSPADLRLAASIVARAEAVFFSGGNQAHYAAWAGTELMSAVQGVYERGGVVGGSSAGLAILGEYVFDARLGTVTSPEALLNPTSSAITFTRRALQLPPLAGVITDTHFRARDRFGRLAVFMARQVAEEAVPSVLGIGVDEDSAVVIDRAGRASLLRQGTSMGSAYFVIGGAASQLTAQQPLVYSNLTVVRLDSSGQFFDVARRCGSGPRYVLDVDARQVDPYAGVNPYAAAGVAGACP